MRNLKIYYGHLGYERKSVWSDTYTHLSRQHKMLIHNYERNSSWSLETYIHLYHFHHCGCHCDKLHNYKRSSGWSLDTYIHIYYLYHYDKLNDC